MDMRLGITASALALFVLGAGTVPWYPHAGTAVSLPSYVHVEPEGARETVREDQYVAAPVRISIPTIGVTADIEPTGIVDGRMGVPSEWNDVAWYERGARPGERGRAVLAGHLDSHDGPAVFWNMKNLNAGDDILVTDAEEVVRRFRVARMETYEDGSAPVHEIFGDFPSPQIILITCDGAWDHAAGRYKERLVVYADQVAE